jgi:hypothetical protein
MTNCDFITRFAASNIEAKSFDVLSSVSSLAASVKNRANVLRVAKSLYTLNRTLAKFLDESHEMMSGKKPVPQPTEPSTPHAMRTTADNFEQIHRMLQYIGELGRRARLTNNSLTAGSLKSLLRHSEELLDFADWLETVADPKGVKGVFERAKQERDKGEVYDLTHVG